MRRFVMLTAGLLLAGCGDRSATPQPEPSASAAEGSYAVEGGETRASVRTRDGSLTTLRAGEKVPVRLPGGFSVAPGLEVVGNAHVVKDGKDLVQLTLRGSPTVETVVAHYRREADAAGVPITVDIAAPDATSIAGERKDGLTFSLIASRAGRETTTAQLNVNEGLR